MNVCFHYKIIFLVSIVHGNFAISVLLCYSQCIFVLFVVLAFFYSVCGVLCAYQWGLCYISSNGDPKGLGFGVVRAWCFCSTCI